MVTAVALDLLWWPNGCSGGWVSGGFGLTLGSSVEILTWFGVRGLVVVMPCDVHKGFVVASRHLWWPQTVLGGPEPFLVAPQQLWGMFGWVWVDRGIFVLISWPGIGLVAWSFLVAPWSFLVATNVLWWPHGNSEGVSGGFGLTLGSSVEFLTWFWVRGLVMVIPCDVHKGFVVASRHLWWP